MNWMSLGLAAACGALAGVIAGIYSMNADDKRTKFGAAFAITFVVLYAITRVAVLPRLETWYNVRNAEAELLELPAYQALKKYDRETYDRLVADFRSGLESGAEKDQVIATIRGHMMKVIESRLPRASDEAVVKYMGITIQELEVMMKKGGDLCFRFLFPQPGKIVDASEHLSKKMQQEDIAALAEVIKTSAEDPQPVPEGEQFTPTLQAIFGELQSEHGDDVMMLQDPTSPAVDKRKVCRMSADMYHQIFALPASESGPLLRYLLAQ